VTIGTSLGWSRDGVAAGLSITNASSVTESASCTSPKLAKGVTYAAWPVGNYYSYKIVESGSLGQQTSGTLHAFVPGHNAIACGVK
jgi:hypothetical protein